MLIQSPALFAVCLWLAIGCAPDKDRDFTNARHRMLHDQLTGHGRGIKDERVLAAMRTVPRHEFVPEGVRLSAYDDSRKPSMRSCVG